MTRSLTDDFGMKQRMNNSYEKALYDRLEPLSG